MSEPRNRKRPSRGRDEHRPPARPSRLCRQSPRACQALPRRHQRRLSWCRLGSWVSIAGILHRVDGRMTLGHRALPVSQLLSSRDALQGRAARPIRAGTRWSVPLQAGGCLGGAITRRATREIIYSPECIDLPHLGCTPNWLRARRNSSARVTAAASTHRVNFEGPARDQLSDYANPAADDGQIEVDKSRKGFRKNSASGTTRIRSSRYPPRTASDSLKSEPWRLGLHP